MCELEFCTHYRFSPYLKKKKKVHSVLEPGTKVRCFQIFTKVDQFLFEYNSRKNYSNLSFYVKQTSLCIMNTFKLPFGICPEMHLELPLFFYRCQFRFWNWRLVV